MPILDKRVNCNLFVFILLSSFPYHLRELLKWDKLYIRIGNKKLNTDYSFSGTFFYAKSF